MQTPVTITQITSTLSSPSDQSSNLVPKPPVLSVTPSQLLKSKQGIKTVLLMY